MNYITELQNSYGNHFQDIFTQLMKEKYSYNYQETSTNGNIGDMKVDGILNNDTAFAVYAPETYNDKKTISKMKLDFNGFLKNRMKGNWQSIEKYIFVIKRDRKGATPTVLDLVTEFNKTFPVDIFTMDDLEMLTKTILPFSSDGILLNEFKVDITDIMEYIIDTDFAAEPFRISLADEIEANMNKWLKKKNTFKNNSIEELKKEILKTLNGLYSYLTPDYFHAISNGHYLIFNNDSWEVGERLRNELQPQTYKIRKETQELLDKLYNIND